jgi:hypothetical protein
MSADIPGAAAITLAADDLVRTRTAGSHARGGGGGGGGGGGDRRRTAVRVAWASGTGGVASFVGGFCSLPCQRMSDPARLLHVSEQYLPTPNLRASGSEMGGKAVSGAWLNVAGGAVTANP